MTSEICDLSLSVYCTVSHTSPHTCIDDTEEGSDGRIAAHSSTLDTLFGLDPNKVPNKQTKFYREFRQQAVARSQGRREFSLS